VLALVRPRQSQTLRTAPTAVRSIDSADDVTADLDSPANHTADP
jgi:hypothetical protein